MAIALTLYAITSAIATVAILTLGTVHRRLKLAQREGKGGDGAVQHASSVPSTRREGN
jgi:hypothetical protein